MLILQRDLISLPYIENLKKYKINIKCPKIITAERPK